MVDWNFFGPEEAQASAETIITLPNGLQLSVRPYDPSTNMIDTKTPEDFEVHSYHSGDLAEYEKYIGQYRQRAGRGRDWNFDHRRSYLQKLKKFLAEREKDPNAQFPIDEIDKTMDLIVRKPTAGM